jgi:hypothetical protein
MTKTQMENRLIGLFLVVLGVLSTFIDGDAGGFALLSILGGCIFFEKEKVID